MIWKSIHDFLCLSWLSLVIFARLYVGRFSFDMLLGFWMYVYVMVCGQDFFMLVCIFVGMGGLSFQTKKWLYNEREQEMKRLNSTSKPNLDRMFVKEIVGTNYFLLMLFVQTHHCFLWALRSIEISISLLRDDVGKYVATIIPMPARAWNTFTRDVTCPLCSFNSATTSR